jgi:hypothetical protein
MIVNASELFEVDVEQFIEALQAIYSYAGNLENIIERGTYTRENILYELENISRLVSELRKIFTLISIKANRYRPNNTLLHSYLKHIDGYIKRLGTILWMTETAYQRDLSYSIDNLYRALISIREIIEEIKSQLDIAITKGAFR